MEEHPTTCNKNNATYCTYWGSVRGRGGGERRGYVHACICRVLNVLVGSGFGEHSDIFWPCASYKY